MSGDLTESGKEDNYSNSSASEKKNKMTEYEKQRLSRIRENQARLQALGLPKMATSLMGLRQNENRKTTLRKGKAKMVEDEDYRPLVGEEEGSSSSSIGDDDDDDEFVGDEKSGSRSAKMMTNRNSKSRKKVSIQKILNNSDVIDDDKDIKQAIALSLKEFAGVSNNSGRSSHNSNDAVKKDRNNDRKGNAIKEESGNRKRKKPISSRVQMTEDEVILHFFQFDEAGKGSITLKDLKRVAMAHDFMWTDKEMVDMIYCFDSNGDGKLNLDDFWKIVSGCNMIHQV